MSEPFCHQWRSFVRLLTEVLNHTCSRNLWWCSYVSVLVVMLSQSVAVVMMMIGQSVAVVVMVIGQSVVLVDKVFVTIQYNVFIKSILSFCSYIIKLISVGAPTIKIHYHSVHIIKLIFIQDLHMVREIFISPLLVRVVTQQFSRFWLLPYLLSFWPSSLLLRSPSCQHPLVTEGRVGHNRIYIIFIEIFFFIYSFFFLNFLMFLWGFEKCTISILWQVSGCVPCAVTMCILFCVCVCVCVCDIMCSCCSLFFVCACFVDFVSMSEH